MTNEITKVSVDNVGDVLREITEAFYNIPFENSEFQTKAFVLAAQITPGRAYRAIGLRMQSKIQAVKHNLFERQKKQVDIDEKKWRLENEEMTPFERRRVELDLAQMQDDDGWFDKLLNDAISELNLLYAELKKYPKYTRESFEREEYEHFTARLDRQLKAPGAQESIVNMTQDLPQFEGRLAIARELLKAVEYKE